MNQHSQHNQHNQQPAQAANEQNKPPFQLPPTPNVIANLVATKTNTINAPIVAQQNATNTMDTFNLKPNPNVPIIPMLPMPFLNQNVPTTSTIAQTINTNANQSQTQVNIPTRYSNKAITKHKTSTITQSSTTTEYEPEFQQIKNKR